jgi:hypothetical protein
LAFSALVFACAPEGPDPDISAVKRRASFVLGCPASKLRTVWLDEDYNTMGVSGCGTKLVYVRVRGSAGEDDQWIQNSDSRRRRDQ